MRARRRLVAALALAALLLAGPAPAVAEGELSPAEREAKLRELSQLRERIKALQTRLDDIRSEHAAMREALRDTEQRISRLVNSLKRLALGIRDHQRELERLQAARQRHQADLEVHRELLGEQIRAAYAVGRQEYLKMLLNQEDPAALGRVLRYYDYFHAARSAQIDAARRTLTELETVGRRIAEETDALEAKRASQEREKRALEQTYRERAQVVAKLNRDLEEKGQELARLVENERRLEDLLQALHQLLADIPAAPAGRRPFADLRGALPWPAQGQVEPLFGQARGIGRLVWNGIRIRAREGAEVRAVSHGRVAFADWLRGYGLLLILDHGDGYMSLYGHNQSLFKETGDWVEAGEVIAGVGRSGGQAESALYFEIRRDGQPADPVHWCRR